jgi:PAS domain S-box-containing protein
LDTKPVSGQLPRIRQMEDEHGFGLVGTFYLDHGNKIVYADRTLSAMYGLVYNENGMSASDFLKNILEEDLEKANTIREFQINKGEPYEVEYRVKFGKNKIRWVLVRAQKKKAGNDIFYEGIVIDITVGKESEHALKAQNKLIKTITDNATSALFLMNNKGYCTFINPAGEAMFGYSQEEISSKPLHYLIHHHRPDGSYYPMDECPLDSALPQNFEMRAHEDLFFKKDGTSIPVLCAASPIFENGVPVATVIEVRDITNHKKAEALLVQHAERVQLLNSIGSSISENLNLQEILQKVTDAVTKLTGANFGAFFYNTTNSSGESYVLYTLSGAPREAFERFGLPRNTAVFHATFGGEGVVRVPDITKDPRYGKNAPYNGMPVGHLPVVSYMAVPVRSKSGNVIGGLFLGHKEADIFTAEHESMVLNIASQAAIALDNARLYEEVKELSIKKDEFLSIASHELKTPLTSLKAFNQLLQRTHNPEMLSVFLGKSALNIERLERLVNDLLDVTKINAGKILYDMQPFDFRMMLKESIESVQHTTTTHEIILHADLEVVITGDRMRLEQVMNNFLTNAVKYSPGGKKVLVNAKLEEGNIMVSIQDFGIGIQPDHLKRLFERFYRADNTVMRFEGLGLGLFISSEILKRHMGDFWIESEPGKGSTFHFRLPENQYNEDVPIINTDIYYRDSIISIMYNANSAYLEVDWMGYQDLASAKAGCLQIQEMINRHCCYKVLNDNSHVLGTWSQAAEWVGREGFPMLEKAGLQHLAWILSPSTFSMMSAKKSIILKEGKVNTKLFTTKLEAREWLESL